MSKHKRKPPRATPQERDVKLLNRVASYMYGERWQRDLATDLRLNERTVRSWVQMRSNITPVVWWEVHKLLRLKLNSGTPVLAAMERRVETLPQE